MRYALSSSLFSPSVSYFACCHSIRRGGGGVCFLLFCVAPPAAESHRAAPRRALAPPRARRAPSPRAAPARSLPAAPPPPPPARAPPPPRAAPRSPAERAAGAEHQARRWAALAGPWYTRGPLFIYPHCEHRLKRTRWQCLGGGAPRPPSSGSWPASAPGNHRHGFVVHSFACRPGIPGNVRFFLPWR